jgi:hypothetical protein
MKLRSFPTVAAFVAAAVWFLAAPSAAEAKGLVIISRGDTIVELGAIKEAAPIKPAPGLPKLPDLKVGYKYSYAGIFWLDIWTWDGEYCLFENKDYMPIDAETAAKMLGVATGDLKVPFWYRYPSLLWILILLVGGFVLLAILGGILEAKENSLAAKLLQESHYQQAVDVAMTPAPTPASEGAEGPEGAESPAPMTTEEAAKAAEEHKAVAFESGMKILLDSGVSEAVAKKNLTALVNVATRKTKKAAEAAKKAEEAAKKAG